MASDSTTTSDDATPAQQSATGRNNEKRAAADGGASGFDGKGLSARQWKAIEALLRGGSDAKAAEAAQVDRGTVYRWRTDHPAFGLELARLRKQAWQQETHRLRAMVGPALDAIQRQLDDPRTSLRAAMALLRLGVPRAIDLAKLNATPHHQHGIDYDDFDYDLDEEDEDDDKAT